MTSVYSYGPTARVRAPRPRRAGRKAALAALAVALGLMAPATGARASDLAGGAPPGERQRAEEARLARIRSDIEELRAHLIGVEKRAGSIVDAVDEIDLKIALLGRETAALESERRSARRAERAARAREARTRASLEASERALRGWLLEVYKRGPARHLRLMAASASPAELAAAQRAVESLSREESRRVEALRADRRRLEAAVDELGRAHRELARIGEDLAQRTESLARARGEKVAVLSGLRAEQASQETALRELVQVENSVRALLRELRDPAPGDPLPSRGFARFRGLLDWPAAGRLLIPFGNVRHPRFSTEVPHPGIDIAVPPGEDVRALFDGRVVFSSWFRGYGQMIVIDHGDGYLSIYGHLDERLVSVGDEVLQTQSIARSGQGGTLESPALYLEIRHDGKPQDPMLWLRGPGARGTDTVPAALRGRAQPRGAP